MVKRISDAVLPTSRARVVGIDVEFGDEFNLADEIGDVSNSAPLIAFDPYLNLILASNPIAYFRLGNNGVSKLVYDESVNRNHGNANPSPTITYGVPGALNNNDNKAVNFTDGKLDIGSHSAYVITNEFTLELWMKQDGKSGSQYLIEFENNKLVILYAQIADTIEFFTNAYTGSNPRPSSQMTVDDMNWHLIHYVYDGITWKGLIDGVIQFSLPLTFSINEMLTTFRIGQANNGANEYEGSLDEIAIYNYALDDSVMLDHHNAGINPTSDVVLPFTPKLDELNISNTMELSFDALTVAKYTGFWGNVKVDKFISSDKVYWEVPIPLLVNTTNLSVGVVRSEHASDEGSIGNTSVDKIYGYEWWGNTGGNSFYNNAASLPMPTYTAGFNPGELLRCRMDPIALTFEIAVDGGGWALTPFSLSSGGSWTPAVNIQNKGQIDIILKDGFNYDIPVGYKAFNLGT